MQPESEIIRFIQTWLIICTSLTYTYLLAKLVPPGKIRFLLILPVVLLFLLLPLRLTSVNLGGITSFFISWLATFKLILFSFNKPPLTSTSLIPFLVAASLPIRITPRSKLDRIPPPNSSSSLTICFVMTTAFWLFFPEILRGKMDVRSFQEYAAMGELVRSVIDGTLFRSFNDNASIQYFFEQVVLF